MRITGGGSRSDLWNQIMADVLGIACGRGEQEESTAVGAATLATYGAGEFSDLAKATDEMVNISQVWNPIAENTKKYDTLFDIANRVYKSLDENNLYADLAHFMKL